MRIYECFVSLWDNLIEWAASLWVSIRSFLPASEGEFWTAISAITTACAAIVALLVGLAPLWVERRRQKAEALIQAARFVVVCRVSAASLLSVYVGFQKQPREKLGVHHCDILIESVKRAEFPTLISTPDLRRLSLLIGGKRSLALAIAFGTIDSLMSRAKALRVLCEQQTDPAFLAKHFESFLKDVKGASDILRDVRAVLERKLGRQM